MPKSFLDAWYDLMSQYEVPSMPEDAVYVDTVTPISSNVNTAANLTEGQYKFTWLEANGVVDLEAVYDEVEFDVEVPTEQGTVRKRVSVDRMVFNPGAGTLETFVTVHENPIPLILVYGVVAAVILAAGAISVNSVLDNVEKVVDTPTVKMSVVAVAVALIGGLFGRGLFTK